MFDDQQPATVAQLLFDDFPARALVLRDALFDPIVDPTDGLGVLAALGPPTDNLFKGVAGDDQVAAGFVKAQVGFVAQHQAVVFVVDGKALGNATQRLAQQAAGFFGVVLAFFVFARAFGDAVFEIGVGLGQPVDHSVEGGRQASEFVLAAFRQARYRTTAGGNFFGRCRYFAKRSGDEAGTGTGKGDDADDDESAEQHESGE